jgi:hypothetical protein
MKARMIQIKRKLNAAISSTEYHRDERKEMLQALNTIEPTLDEAAIFKLIDGFEAHHKQWCNQKRKDARNAMYRIKRNAEKAKIVAEST